MKSKAVKKSSAKKKTNAALKYRKKTGSEKDAKKASAQKNEEVKTGFGIKTWADVCKFHKRDPKKMPYVSTFPKDLQGFILNTFKVALITSAVNASADGKIWQPNWNDSSENKYRLWFWIKESAQRPSGFGFLRTDCDCTSTYAIAGSRLLFKSGELALHAAKCFPEEYKGIMLIEEKK